jgi:hypothetical protein
MTGADLSKGNELGKADEFLGRDSRDERREGRGI